MITSEEFWKVEVESPILKRNAGHISHRNAEECISQISELSDIIEAKLTDGFNVSLDAKCEDEAMGRIFKLDAQRTFTGDENRRRMIQVLTTIWVEIQDYHQGMAFIVAFLLLFFKDEDVAKFVVSLDKYYIPGYFKSAPIAYVRDSRVFLRMLKSFAPEAARAIENSVPPEAFVSKWFIGFCINVLTFEALMLYVKFVFDKGSDYLFQFGIALVQACESEIVAAKSSSTILSILRLDTSLYPNSKASVGSDVRGSFFTNIVLSALEVDLSSIDLEALRKDVEEELAEEEIKRKKRIAEMNYSDDEIVFSDED